MSTFSITGLTLCAESEQKARTIRFHPQCTVLVGENQTGKSAIMKSIYSTLGADTANVHPRWKALGVLCLLDFNLDGLELSILRLRSSFGLFHRSGALIGAFPRVTEGMSPVLAKMLGFDLRLRSRSEGETSIPPPAFKFLPYYIDQDASWSLPWNSFARLTQFPDWKRDVAAYHTGILPGAYYRAKGELIGARAHEATLLAESEAVERVFESRQAEWQDAPVTLDPIVFRFEIEKLSRRAEHLRDQQGKLRRKSVEVATLIVTLEAQIAILERVRRELGLDFAHAAALDGAIRCPTCAAEYPNHAADRFPIAADRDRADEMLNDLRLQLDDALEERTRITHRIEALEGQYANIDALMETKREDVSLGQLIRSAGRDELQRSLKDGMDASQLALEKQRGRVATAQAELSKFRDVEKKREVLAYMRTLLEDFYHALDVRGVDPNTLREPESPPRSTGSEMPRAILAYCFAVLHAARRFAPDQTSCPVVVDSPNQQGQDDLRLDKILRLVFDRIPDGMQLVVASERLPEKPDRDSEIIELTERYGLLNAAEYPAARSRIRGMREIMVHRLEEQRRATEG